MQFLLNLFLIIWLSNILTLSVPYSRNAWCALKLISTFLSPQQISCIPI